MKLNKLKRTIVTIWIIGLILSILSFVNLIFWYASMLFMLGGIATYIKCYPKPEERE
jgi:hypothetical protein